MSKILGIALASTLALVAIPASAAPADTSTAGIQQRGPRDWTGPGCVHSIYVAAGRTQQLRGLSSIRLRSDAPNRRVRAIASKRRSPVFPRLRRLSQRNKFTDRFSEAASSQAFSESMTSSLKGEDDEQESPHPDCHSLHSLWRLDTVRFRFRADAGAANQFQKATYLVLARQATLCT